MDLLLGARWFLGKTAKLGQKEKIVAYPGLLRVRTGETYYLSNNHQGRAGNRGEIGQLGHRRQCDGLKLSCGCRNDRAGCLAGQAGVEEPLSELRIVVARHVNREGGAA
jgi:hypothetical protein